MAPIGLQTTPVSDKRIKIEGEGMTQASLVTALFVQQNLTNLNIRYLQASSLCTLVQYPRRARSKVGSYTKPLREKWPCENDEISTVRSLKRPKYGDLLHQRCIVSQTRTFPFWSLSYCCGRTLDLVTGRQSICTCVVPHAQTFEMGMLQNECQEDCKSYSLSDFRTSV